MLIHILKQSSLAISRVCTILYNIIYSLLTLQYTMLAIIITAVTPVSYIQHKIMYHDIGLFTNAIKLYIHVLTNCTLYLILC